ncbi:MAG: LytR/AlgR family response regulator transcription factor [Crocinitomicaceae bacterium]
MDSLKLFDEVDKLSDKNCFCKDEKTNWFMNCLIVDDDPLICDLIKHFCSKQLWIDSCLAVGDGSQALQAVNTTSFNLIFLDFNLPDLNGKSLLELLPIDTPVIMVTSEKEFAAESYDYNQVIDFLVKPVGYERFLKALLKYQSIFLTKQKIASSNIVVKVGNDSVILKLADIIYMKSEGNYVMFYLKNEKVLGLVTLKSLVDQLPFQFARVHKSFIVNFNYLKAISADELKFESHTVPIGASYKEKLMIDFNQWSDNC